MDEKEYGTIGTRVGRITSVGISDSIRKDLGLKGGGLPDMVLPEESEVSFVYLLNPNITVSTDPSIVVRTSIAQYAQAVAVSTKVDSFTLTVPDGADKWQACVRCNTTPSGSANLDLRLQFSDNGTTWFDSLATATSPTTFPNNSGTMTNAGDVLIIGDSTSLDVLKFNSESSLPKFMRISVRNNSALNQIIVDWMLTVS